MDTTSWAASALDITGDFESPGKTSYSTVTGNFDGMGLSCGALQWTFATGNQQKLVRDYLKQHGEAPILMMMPKWGKEYIHLCSQASQVALSVISSWSIGWRVDNEIKMELERFWGSDEMRAIQIHHAGSFVMEARRMAMHFEMQGHKAFCFFFDVAVQNGSMKGITADDLDEYVSSYKTIGQAVDAVIQWCADCPSTMATFGDTRRNANLWSHTYLGVDDQSKCLLVLAWLRAMKSSQRWRANVLNRKGTIAIGQGYVEGEKKDIRDCFHNDIS